MEDGNIRVEDALRMIADNLCGIMVPAGLTEQIGIPIISAVKSLRECVRAMQAPNRPEGIPKDADAIDLGTVDLDAEEPAVRPDEI